MFSFAWAVLGDLESPTPQTETEVVLRLLYMYVLGYLRSLGSLLEINFAHFGADLAINIESNNCLKLAQKPVQILSNVLTNSWSTFQRLVLEAKAGPKNNSNRCDSGLEFGRSP